MADVLVTVARFEWLMHADLARARLEAAGIESHLADEHVATIFWHYAKGIGGLRLQVGAEDVEDAEAVLFEPEQADEAPTLSGIDASADRFLRTTVFGAVAFPLQLYALWLLFGLFPVRAQLSAAARRQVVTGAVLLAVECGWPVFFVFMRFLGPN